MSSLEALFCHIDDFCQKFAPHWHSQLIGQGVKTRKRARSLCLSEIMTILVTFHQNHYRNFKHYYLDHVCVYLRPSFPGLPGYQRFVEWIPSTWLPLCVYLKGCFGQCTGISFQGRYPNSRLSQSPDLRTSGFRGIGGKGENLDRMVFRVQTTSRRQRARRTTQRSGHAR
jgi:hypothetical protein